MDDEGDDGAYPELTDESHPNYFTIAIEGGSFGVVRVGSENPDREVMTIIISNTSVMF